MMPLQSPITNPAPANTNYEYHATMKGAHGSFDGHVVPDITERPRLSGKLWRYTGFATLLLVVAGYILLQSHLESVSRREELNATLALHNAFSNATLKIGNQIKELTTFSDQNKSDGLSKLESQFLNTIDTIEIRKFHGAYASVPHVAGSEQDYKTALFTAEQFQSFGLKTEIVEYYPLLSLPVHRKLSILAPSNAKRELNLTEEAIPGDSCTSNEDALPPYFGYSDSGNVTASVVYINYARPADFQWLHDNNVTLKGKIALVRYGGNFRGLKVMLAEKHGMVGVLIYSDPFDDGYTRGRVYPDGPWRPDGSFQRGSVQYNSIAAGDPLTPGFPSLPGQPYLSKKDSISIPHIPALPLSYGQARYILEAMGGKIAPASWQGALNLESGHYFVGDDEATVLNMDVVMDNSIGPIWNVIGTIEGTDEPERMVMIGNHRDAWVCGAVDPSSGSAVMLEIARGLGKLLKNGWKPRRTLVIASWDGEELGLLGSTEFAEDHSSVLKEQTVAYVNVDNLVGSLVSVASSPSIAKFLQQTALLIPGNPFQGFKVTESLYEQWVQQTAMRRSRLEVGVDDLTLAPDYLIQRLGSGKDFTPFSQYLGITSADLGYTISSATYGTYHSTMDSIRYVETVGDPHYATHTTVAKWWGLITLRLVDSAIVPFDFSTYGPEMLSSLLSYEKITLDIGRRVDYSKLYEAIETFTRSAEIFQVQVAEFAQTKETLHNYEMRRFWNEKLINLERHLITDVGLPHRPWFKHLIFGPGFYEGYKGSTFPGVSDCLVFQDSNEAIQSHIDDVVAVINSAAAYLTSS